jgi:hypothetical protein
MHFPCGSGLARESDLAVQVIVAVADARRNDTNLSFSEKLQSCY